MAKIRRCPSSSLLDWPLDIPSGSQPISV